MGVERPNVVLYTLGGPRGSSGLEDPPFVSLPPFHLPPTPVPPLSPLPPLPSHPLPCFSGSSLLGWVSLSPFFPPSSLSDRPRQKTCQLPLPLPVHGHGGGGGGGRGEGWTKGVGGGKVIFFRGHRGGGWMIFATISLGKSIPTSGRQAGRQANQSLSAISLPNDFSPDLSQQILGVAVFECFEGWEK